MVIAAVVIRNADRGRREESHSYRHGERRPCPVAGSRARMTRKVATTVHRANTAKTARRTGPLVNSHQPTSTPRSASLTRHAKTAKQTLTPSVEAARTWHQEIRVRQTTTSACWGPQAGPCWSRRFGPRSLPQWAKSSTLVRPAAGRSPPLLHGLGSRSGQPPCCRAFQLASGQHRASRGSRDPDVG
jgi:hypothetical protein